MEEKDGGLVLTSEVTHIVSVCARGQRYACVSVCVCVNVRISMAGVSTLRLGVVRADLSCARINVQCNSSFVSAQTTHIVLIVKPVALDMFGAFALFRMNADII